MVAKRNPIAAALRTGRIGKPQTMRPKKGKGSYRRRPRGTRSEK